MIQEIVDGLDIHSDNAIKFFGDIQYRQVAKIFSFRLLYGGGAFAFHMDYRMPSLGLKKWQRIVEEFNDKYKGLIAWQNTNYREVIRNGLLKTFTGREYIFQKFQDGDGAWKYSRPTVCNYPVQGTATADIMPLCMLVIFRRLRDEGYFEKGVKLINQVHDSIILDVPNIYIDKVAEVCYNVFTSIPDLVRHYFQYDWIVPMTGEIKVGNNWSDMEKLKL